MKTKRFLLLALLCGATFAATSCGDSSPTAPATARVSATSTPAANGLLDGLLARTGLLSCRPLPAAHAVKTIGVLGGIIEVGPHALLIPPGALRSQVTITADAPSGTVNKVHFLPEGLQFAHPAVLTMSYANCNLLGVLLPKHIAYVDGNLNILYLLESLDLFGQQTVVGKVEHFSDYVIAW